MNKLSEAKSHNIPSTQWNEAQLILDAASADAGFDKMLKFKKGVYYREGEEVPLGSRFIAHAVGWTKTWVKFLNGTVAERKVYRVNKGERAPERDELPDHEELHWPIGLDGRPSDPWVFQYLLPLEDLTTGDVNILVASSFGGKRAVADLCSAYARKAAKQAGCGQPIIKLGKVMMPTRKFGDVPRPHFEIVGWDEREGIREVRTENLKNEDMNDDIPF
jgi:hypothetical protein